MSFDSTGSEDSHKVRQEERNCNRFCRSWPLEESRTLPDAPFQLCKVKHKLATRRATTIRVPLNFDWNLKSMFQGTIAMKSHSWKQMVSTGILKFCIRGLLGRWQRQTLFFLCDTLASLCAKVVHSTQLDTLEQDVHTVLSLPERDYPVSLQMCVFHLLHHLPFYLKWFGPVYSFWMFPFKRFNSWLIRRDKNYWYPESTLIETYCLHEWANFLQATGDLPNDALLHAYEATLSTHHDSRSIFKQLTPYEHAQLEIYYQQVILLYHSLCEKYREEKRKARGKHDLRCFPETLSWTPTCGPALTPQETEMCKEVSCDITCMDRYTFEDFHGRTIVLTSKNGDTAHMSSSYTYVYAPTRKWFRHWPGTIFLHAFVFRK